MSLKTLIFMQAFLKNEGQCALFRTAMALAERLNPECDFLVIDNAGPMDARIALGGHWSESNDIPLPDDGDAKALPWSSNGLGKRTIAHFASAIGHFHYDKHNMVQPRDGPGRAFTCAATMACLSGYDRLVTMESDLLCALPAEWAFERLDRPVGCQPRMPYGYLDWQVVWIADLKWFVQEFDFPAKYDWPSRKPDWLGDDCGEVIFERILGDYAQPLPVRGGRGDAIKLVRGTLRERFPEGCDFITHVEREDFALFLVMNGQEDLMPPLWS
jgi:hypothetical protein